MNKFIKLFSLSSLERLTSGRAIIKEIDGLRFVAIIGVVMMHFRTALAKVFGELEGFSLTNELFGKGGQGVFFFFGISGFILGLPFAREHIHKTKPVNLKNYFYRRLTRLEPPYLIIMTILLVGIVAVGVDVGDTNILHNYLASILYSHYFVFGEWSLINPVTWSLEVEVQFYILAPLLALVFKIRNRILRITIIVAAILLIMKGAGHYREFYKSLHLNKSILVYAQYFLAGFLFSEVYLINKSAFEKKNLIGDVLFISGFVLLYAPFEFASNRWAITLSILLLLLGAFKGKISSKILSLKWVYITGGMCYTIYLIHYAFFDFAFRFIPVHGSNFEITFIFYGIIVLPILWLISAFTYKLIERPFMDKNWITKLKSRLKLAR